MTPATAAVIIADDNETALAVVCVARHSSTYAELAETCIMLGLDGLPPEPKTWNAAAGRGVPDSFRRGQRARRK